MKTYKLFNNEITKRGFAVPVVILIIIVIMMISLSFFSFMTSGEKRSKQFFGDTKEFSAIRTAIAFHCARRRLYPDIGGNVNGYNYLNTGDNAYMIDSSNYIVNCNYTVDIENPSDFFLSSSKPPGTDNVSRIQFDIIDETGKIVNRYFLRLYFTKGGLLSQKPLVLDLINLSNISITNVPLIPADITKLKAEVQRINNLRFENRPLAYQLEKEIGLIVKNNPSSTNIGRKICSDISGNFSSIVAKANSFKNTLNSKVRALVDENLQFKKRNTHITHNAPTIQRINKIKALVYMQELIQDKIRATIQDNSGHSDSSNNTWLTELNGIKGINKMMTIYSAVQLFKIKAVKDSSFTTSNFITDMVNRNIIEDKHLEFQTITDRDLFTKMAKVYDSNLLVLATNTNDISKSDVLAYKSNSNSPTTILTGEIEDISVIRRTSDLSKMPGYFAYTNCFGTNYDIYMADIEGTSKTPFISGPGNQMRPSCTNFSSKNYLFYVDWPKTVKYRDLESGMNYIAANYETEPISEVLSLCPFRAVPGGGINYLLNCRGTFTLIYPNSAGILLANTSKNGSNRYSYSSIINCFYGAPSPETAHNKRKHFYPLAMSIKANEWFIAFITKTSSGSYQILAMKSFKEKKGNATLFTLLDPNKFHKHNREEKLTLISDGISGDFTSLSKIDNETFLGVCKSGTNSIVYRFWNTGNKFDKKDKWKSQQLLSVNRDIKQVAYIKE